MKPALNSRPKVGVIGLGIMGGAMAEALLENGYAVVGYDVAAAARARLAKAGGKPARSSTAVAQAADVVIVALATIAALDDAAAQIASARRARGAPQLVVIEMSTLPIADKERARAQVERAGGVPARLSGQWNRGSHEGRGVDPLRKR